MKTWWRVIAGLGAGAANSFANGMNWKEVLLSLALAGLGIVSHVTSTSDPTQPDGTKK